MRVLLTGFAPFGSDTVNPSWQAVEAVQKNADTNLQNIELHIAELPVEFITVQKVLEQLIENINPDLVLATGLAGNRAAISLERVAINLMDARIADNIGYQPVDEPIFSGKPTAFFTELPVKACLEQLEAANIPAKLSSTAGEYVCNTVMYFLEHYRITHENKPLVGFVHVPATPEIGKNYQGMPSLSLATITEA